MAPVRLTICGQGISIDPGDAWVIPEPWTEPRIQREHGVYFRSVPNELQIHVRQEHCSGCDLTSHGLLEMMRRPRWASSPFDEEVVASGPLIVVAATFEMPPDNGIVWVVREYLISDGKHLADAAMPGPRAEVELVRASALRLLGSIVFAGDG